MLKKNNSTKENQSSYNVIFKPNYGKRNELTFKQEGRR